MRQLAQLVGISNPYLSQIERGLRAPSEKVLEAIAEGLQTNVDALYAQAGYAPPSEEDEEEPAAVAAIRDDVRLSRRQKQAMIEIYEAFTAGSGPPRRRRRTKG
jgi:transcriptional regulator with XRE-family HTH domain